MFLKIILIYINIIYRPFLLKLYFTEGPTTHDQPTYASVPGIKVYGMVCVSKSDSINTDDMERKIRVLKTNEESSSTGTQIFINSFHTRLRSDKLNKIFTANYSEDLFHILEHRYFIKWLSLVTGTKKREVFFIFNNIISLECFRFVLK